MTGRESRRPHIWWTCLAAITLLVISATAETRPHYGGTLRVMSQSAPATLEISGHASPIDYWAAARVLSLIGDTLVRLDAEGRLQPSLAVAWQGDASARRWEFRLRQGVKFQDGTPASPATIAQILSANDPGWIVRATADSVSIESPNASPSLLAELALPNNLVLKRNASGLPIGTGPFLVAEWQPGKVLKLAANEENWLGRPYVDAIEIEFGKSLRDQATALDLEKVDLIDVAAQASGGAQRRSSSSSSSVSVSSSLPVELLALVFNPNSKARTDDPRLREALALAIDRKPIQSVLLKGAGEPTASILPNWLTGYSALFSVEANPQRARALVANRRLPPLNLTYDPRDPQAQLIAERIALNARDAGITVQVSLSGVEDIRLMRVVLPSSNPATALDVAARQMGLPAPLFPNLRGNALDDLYSAEHTLLDGLPAIPLFHLPVASALGARVRDWQPGRLGEWNGTDSSLGDLWLAGRQEAGSR